MHRSEDMCGVRLPMHINEMEQKFPGTFKRLQKFVRFLEAL